MTRQTKIYLAYHNMPAVAHKKCMVQRKIHAQKLVHFPRGKLINNYSATLSTFSHLYINFWDRNVMIINNKLMNQVTGAAESTGWLYYSALMGTVPVRTNKAKYNSNRSCSRLAERWGTGCNKLLQGSLNRSNIHCTLVS